METCKRGDPVGLLPFMDDQGAVDLQSFAKISCHQAGQKRKRLLPNAIAKLAVPRLSAGSAIPPNEQIEELFVPFSLLHLQSPRLEEDHEGGKRFTWKKIQGLFVSLQRDLDSWCIETPPNTDYHLKGRQTVDPAAFLSPTLDHPQRGYCSFLLQKDVSQLEETLRTLPVQDLCSCWFHGACVWFFFGRNSSGQEAIQGRPNHTDSVTHDGTWHYQLSGTKRWYLRPTEELKATWKSHGFDLADETPLPLTVDCCEGDILLINTRLWWHCTEIPVQPMPSVSYARDFYFGKPLREENTATNMSNVDGMYAASDLEAGVIVFRQDDMPDCELHRSSDPNCEVVFLNDENVHAVVSIRAIRAGEFFCVAESSSEEEEEADDDDEEEDDDDDDEPQES
jgi:U3 small nucleolar RNA-associated protein 6